MACQVNSRLELGTLGGFCVASEAAEVVGMRFLNKSAVHQGGGRGGIIGSADRPCSRISVCRCLKPPCCACEFSTLLEFFNDKSSFCFRKQASQVDGDRGFLLV